MTSSQKLKLELIERYQPNGLVQALVDPRLYLINYSTIIMPGIPNLYCSINRFNLGSTSACTKPFG